MKHDSRNYMISQFISFVICVIIYLIVHEFVHAIDAFVGTTRWHPVLLLALVVALCHAPMYKGLTKWLETFDDREE